MPPSYRPDELPDVTDPNWDADMVAFWETVGILPAASSPITTTIPMTETSPMTKTLIIREDTGMSETEEQHRNQ